MVTQTIQFDSDSLSEIGTGTITAFLFSGTTLVATLSSITENATLKGNYTGTVADIAAGTYRLVVKFNGYTSSEPRYQVTLLLATGTYVATDGLGGSGTGARTVTITVNDGATALQNAIVRLTEGANTYSGTTNVSGVATFNVSDATYTVAITKSGYTYAGTTLVVDGTETPTYSMTIVTVTPPADPALCAVSFHLRDQYGDDQADEPVEITFVKWETVATETPPVVSVPPVQTTNASGLVSVNLYRNATYKIVYGSADYARRVDVVVPDSGTYTVEI